MSAPRIFERNIDLEGRLRLPDWMFDDYHTCYISLGLFSNTYLQLTPEGIYLVMSDELGKAPFEDAGSFRLQRNFHTAEKLALDGVGRVTIPERLLKRAEIGLGSQVVGMAIQTNLSEQPTYWTLEAKQRWMERNPQGQYTLDYYNPL